MTFINPLSPSSLFMMDTRSQCIFIIWTLKLNAIMQQTANWQSTTVSFSLISLHRGTHGCNWKGKNIITNKKYDTYWLQKFHVLVLSLCKQTLMTTSILNQINVSYNLTTPQDSPLSFHSQPTRGKLLLITHPAVDRRWVSIAICFCAPSTSRKFTGSMLWHQ